MFFRWAQHLSVHLCGFHKLTWQWKHSYVLYEHPHELVKQQAYISQYLWWCGFLPDHWEHTPAVCELLHTPHDISSARTLTTLPSSSCFNRNQRTNQPSWTQWVQPCVNCRKGSDLFWKGRNSPLTACGWQHAWRRRSSGYSMVDTVRRSKLPSFSDQSEIFLSLRRASWEQTSCWRW